MQLLLNGIYKGVILCFRHDNTINIFNKNIFIKLNRTVLCELQNILCIMLVIIYIYINISVYNLTVTNPAIYRSYDRLLYFIP